ncbi:HrgC protein [Helicobacter pylori]|uniref:HrgC protein n=1 Tax=Helicobacter pylori TaxID=210 RepID=UPI0013E29F4A|nr:HrgC protein [Helicobacter pylori]
MVATTISLKKDNLIKKGLVGFSWTTFFFGFFVPIIRGDARWAIVMVVAALFTFGLSNIVFAFIYNKQYTTRLLESGYEPADEYSRGILRSRDMIA